MKAEPRIELIPPRFENGQAARPPRRKRGGAGKSLLLLLALGLVTGGGGGYLVWSSSQVDDPSKQALTKPVAKSDLVISVVEDGNLESASNIELKCEVEGTNTTILKIVPDGQQVKKGDELVKLNSSAIEEAIDEQKITLEDAHATEIGAEKDFSAASIAVEEYREGTLKQELEQMDADITQARQNLSSAENTLGFTKKMHRQGYATPLELESKQSLVLQSKLNLGVAVTKKMVLKEFTSRKMVEELEGKRDSFQAKMNAQKIAHDLEVKKLKRLENNLVKCVITAPQDGMVVYANDAGNQRMGQQAVKIEEGSAVHQYQAIIRLPDLSQMQVKALVHESKVDLLRIGMRANVKIQDSEYQGTVAQVATQPEPGGWFGGGVKEYATIVKIDGRPEDLKPGMTAEVEILVAEKKGVLSVPVQAIVEQGKKFYAWVKSDSKPDKRTVLLGATNDTFIEIKDGLLEGDLVLLNPRAVVAEAREDVPQEDVVDISKKFGATAGTVQVAEGDAPKPPVKSDPTAVRTASTPAAAPAPAGTTAAGGAPGGGGPPGGGGAGRGPGGGGGGQRKLPAFKDLDKDGDGKISKEENPSPWFDRQDANADGFVDRKEFKESMDQFQKMMKQRGMGGQGGGGPPQ
ncbi:MAG TPA: HlyD family efflux transporter periplasmic adaptor subunit [Pirellulales bacterium]|nr:HlyD family efflux transporter periplasmic adaptor subunit [Pirellulales bacterium]